MCWRKIKGPGDSASKSIVFDMQISVLRKWQSLEINVEGEERARETEREGERERERRWEEEETDRRREGREKRSYQEGASRVLDEGGFGYICTCAPAYRVRYDVCSQRNGLNSRGSRGSAGVRGEGLPPRRSRPSSLLGKANLLIRAETFQRTLGD